LSAKREFISANPAKVLPEICPTTWIIGAILHNFQNIGQFPTKDGLFDQSRLPYFSSLQLSLTTE
jgi:hypothetical protein